MTIIYQVIFYLVELFILGNGILAIVGIFPHKQKYTMKDDQQKFCVFVPCHNEEGVISATVHNLAQIEYDPALFDIYFLADNCTDNTAAEIKASCDELGKSNFHVFERHVDDPLKKGKPHALRWAMDRLEAENKYYGYYDMFMIFDADNFVDPDILKHVNSQYLEYPEEKRPVMIQTYLDSKNKNSIIARSYYVGYRISNRCAQAARNALGLVPAIGGTGFAMTLNFLKEIGGYNCKTLAEDLEIQTIATMKGKTILFNGNARIYDEKPTGFSQSIVQRTRWSQGHWYLLLAYSWRIFFSMFNFKQWRSILKKIDMIFYLNTMFFICLSAIFFIIQIPFAIFRWDTGIPGWFYIINTVLVVLTMLLLIPITSMYDGPESERKSIWKDYIPNFCAMFVLSIVQTVASFIGLCKCRNQTVWRKTVHKVTTMDDRK